MKVAFFWELNMRMKTGLMAMLMVPCLMEAVRAADVVTARGTLEVGDAETAKLAQRVGYNGVLQVKTKARWDEFMKLAPNLKPEGEIPRVDFSKECVVLVYSSPRRLGESFALSKSDVTAKVPELEFLLKWNDGGEEQREMRSSHFMLAVIPATTSVKVSVQSEGTIAANPVKEFEGVVGDKDGGDWVDGLQGLIELKSPKVAAGEDILVDFVLRMPKIAPPKLPQGMEGQFNKAPKSVQVWDGKYSNGYRNHAFFVTGPDGKTTLVRPKEIREWDKNAPHPETISVGKDYQLPNWAEGDNFKSLKKLGLDTSKPGIYVITGVYEESGGDLDEDLVKMKTPMWGGSIATNTVSVEVK